MKVKYSGLPETQTNVYYRIRPFKADINVHGEDEDFMGLVVKGALKVDSFAKEEGRIWKRAGNALVNLGNGYLGIDTNNSKAVMVSAPVDLSFELVDPTTSKCAIRMGAKYLCKTTDADLCWINGDSLTDNCYWGFEKLIQYDDCAQGHPDKFSQQCGSSLTRPTSWETGMEKLYRLVFKVDKDTYDTYKRNHAFVNLYAALYYDGTGEAYRQKFHTGVDINKNFVTEHEPIYSPINGKVTLIVPRYGVVVIRDDKTGRYFTFMHMWLRSEVGTGNSGNGTKDLRYQDFIRKYPSAALLTVNSNVKKGDILGLQGNVGLDKPNEEDSHLHVEVSLIKPTNVTKIYNAGFVEMYPSILPYDTFNKLELFSSGGGSGGGSGSGSGGNSGHNGDNDPDESEAPSSDKYIEALDYMVDHLVSRGDFKNGISEYRKANNDSDIDALMEAAGDLYERIAEEIAAKFGERAYEEYLQFGDSAIDAQVREFVLGLFDKLKAQFVDEDFDWSSLLNE